MKRSNDRILTTHTGSLPRPAFLLERLRSTNNTLVNGELRPAVCSAVADVVQKQIEVGIDVVSDGEQGKRDYSTYIRDRLNGFGDHPVHLGPTRDQAEFPDYAEALAGLPGGRPVGPPCIGPVSWNDFAAVEHEIAAFQSALVASPGATEAFMTAVSPCQAARFMPNQFYATDEEYLQVLADTLNAEYNAIVAAGFVLQLDCPDLASSWNNLYGHLTLTEFRKVLSKHVEVLNESVKNIPADRMRMHLCWGNYEGPHNHDIPLREIIEIVFTAKPMAVSFEAANPRHGHEWKVFQDVKLPSDKVLIPGAIDSTTNFIEHPELVAERICRFASVVGRENVIAGTDCGFATSAEGSPVFPTIAWAKLKSLVEGAQLASQALWR
jgi:5-methyltetrahydropteroyltriglutamate--homocysteine methyltransferase